MKRDFCFLVIMATLLLAARLASAAETVHLILKADGVLITGESTQTSLGRDKTIECLSWEMGGTLMQPTGVVGAPIYQPITIRKRIDSSSTLLYRAMVRNQSIDGVFKFYRPNPVGDGTTQQFYTVTISGGLVISVRQFVPSTVDPASASLPPMEEVTFVFSRIIWTYTNGATTNEYGDDTKPPLGKTSSKVWDQYGKAPAAAAKAQASLAAPRQKAVKANPKEKAANKPKPEEKPAPQPTLKQEKVKALVSR